MPTKGMGKMDRTERDAHLKAMLEEFEKLMDRWEKKEISKEDYVSQMVRIVSAEIRESEDLAVDMEAEAKHQKLYAEELRRGLALLGIR